MLKDKVLKEINSELNISFGTPFLIEGQSTPYRMKKGGNIERFIGKTWVDSSYCYTDLISLIDASRISLCKDTIEEYVPKGKK